MINFLHTFDPQPIIFSFGPINLRWYGLLISLGFTTALFVTIWLSKRYFKIKSELIFDLAFWLIIVGLIGARLYDVILQLPYYTDHPLQIIQIWKGGLAIHGGLVAGLIFVYFFSHYHKINFFKLTALIVPGLAIGQAIGRFGNYFNQELFGKPTNLPWGIPISIQNRPIEYISNPYFHPTFLYESLACFLIFIIIITTYNYLENKQALNLKAYTWSTVFYVVSYSLIRLSLEFIRLDPTPIFLGWRWPQIFSLILIISSILLLIFQSNVRQKK